MVRWTHRLIPAHLERPRLFAGLAPSFQFWSHRHSGTRPMKLMQAVNFAPFTSGTLTVNYNFGTTNNDMRVFYGNTNVTAGTGVLIYDTGQRHRGQCLYSPGRPDRGRDRESGDHRHEPRKQHQRCDGLVIFRELFKPCPACSLAASSMSPDKSYANIARFMPPMACWTPPSIPAPGRTTRCWRWAGSLTVRSSRAAFSRMSMAVSYNHIARFNADGSIDTTNFFVGTGADDVVYNITIQPLDGTMYVGGAVLVVQRHASSRLHPPVFQRHGGHDVHGHGLQPVCRFEADLFLRFARRSMPPAFKATAM